MLRLLKKNLPFLADDTRRLDMTERQIARKIDKRLSDRDWALTYRSIPAE